LLVIVGGRCRRLNMDRIRMDGGVLDTLGRGLDIVGAGGTNWRFDRGLFMIEFR